MSPGVPPEGSSSGLPGGPEPAPGSERAVREGIAATAEGAAALVPGGRPEERPAAEGEEPRAGAERRLRLQGLAGMTVLGSDGKTVGRVRDIYQQDAGGELAAITVMPRQLSARSVLIPAAAISALPEDAHALGQNAEQQEQEQGKEQQKAQEREQDQEQDADELEQEVPTTITLLIDTATARAGIAPPDTLHADPQVLQDAAEAVGLAPQLAAPQPATPTPETSAAPAPGSPAPATPTTSRPEESPRA